MVRGTRLVKSSRVYSINDIKKHLSTMIGQKIQWDRSRGDGRKKKTYVEGTIVSAYNHLFTVKVNGYIETFSYKDLYIKDIKILSCITGKNILYPLKKNYI
ncbi:MAG: Veg family protein [bacterium]